MNILFLTMTSNINPTRRGIYNDLLNELSLRGHKLYVVSPIERKLNQPTNITVHGNIVVLKVKTLNLTKTSVFEKGIGHLLIDNLFLSAIKKYFNKTRFDMVLYSTPPITFSRVIKYFKKRDNAYTYLLLKDIFPQNAVDIGFMKKGSLLHRYFEKKEKRLYEVSETIGCMSVANKEYILNHHPEISKSKVEVNPNSIKPVCIKYTQAEKKAIREKYKIPTDKKVFFYGGNLGIPQGIDFLIKIISEFKIPIAHILIVGTGTEYNKLANFFNINKPEYATLLSRLPKHEYDSLLAACDVGMIFLDMRFTIPNFPSRILPYLEMKKPVLAATDINTDIGQVIEAAGCGYWVESRNHIEVLDKIKQMCYEDLILMGKKSRELLEREYLVTRSCQLIESKLLSK